MSKSETVRKGSRKPFHMMRVPRELAERLKEAAAEIDRPAVWLLRKILSDYFDSAKKK